jgi:hypothetical protein
VGKGFDRLLEGFDVAVDEGEAAQSGSDRAGCPPALRDLDGDGRLLLGALSVAGRGVEQRGPDAAIEADDVQPSHTVEPSSRLGQVVEGRQRVALRGAQERAAEENHGSVPVVGERICQFVLLEQARRFVHSPLLD